jgi:nitrite reductase (NADH) large subunit
MQMEDLIVVGNGMAGVACLEQILKHSPKFRVTVFGDETHANYNRICSPACWPASVPPTTS